jgi:hypothetical protein
MRIAEQLPAGLTLELVVIDTLSRAMAGGNENSPDDMGKLVRRCDDIRIATGAAVALIHHAGKDEARGARGHSSLKAASDTEIEVSRSEATGVATAYVAKQRDHPSGQTFPFKLEVVEIGQDEDGENVTSCVLIAAEAPARTDSRATRRLTKGAQIALNALREALEECGQDAPASNYPAAGAGRRCRPVAAVRLSAWHQHRRGARQASGVQAGVRVLDRSQGRHGLGSACMDLGMTGQGMANTRTILKDFVRVRSPSRTPNIRRNLFAYVRHVRLRERKGGEMVHSPLNDD